MIVKKGSTVEFFNNIYQKLIKDEELLRLLTYLPRGYDDEGNYNPDPLDDSLDNLVPDLKTATDEEVQEYWRLVDERIVLGEKTSDLESKKICRIYISEGRRRPVFNDYLMATQEVAITIYINEDYDKDIRMSRISDRINELIALERIAGFGMLEYQAGNPLVAPKHYRAYEHLFRMSVTKK